MINERYLIRKKLGEGRNKVFLCSDIENPTEEIAIKILSGNADKVEVASFHDEFINLRRLNHPRIVHALNFGTIVKNSTTKNGITIGSKYFTLEYFDGKPLLKYENINEESLKKILTQICAVLFYLHQSGYIYYDLKPDNILVKNLNDEPITKLIDLGFAQKIDFNGESQRSNNNYVRGTAEYIAPELLKNEIHDSRVDLYSLGIILYRIVYKKFPFSTNSELKIYKAHLEKDFEFKKSGYSSSLIEVIKKLLNKDPEKRYKSSLEILNDLNISISGKITKDLNPARIFVNRRDVLNILDRYINDKSSSEIFTVKGFEGSGKTALTEEINFIHSNSVLIKYDKSKSGYQFLKYFLKEIIFNDFTYSNISPEIKNTVENLIKNPSSELIDELKGIFSKITLESDFVLILDDFNGYDNFTLEMIKDILPIFQVNKIKIVVTEDSDFDYTSDSFHNVREINLTPFTDVQVTELIEKSYNNSFPKEELKKLILLYADLLPGSIEGFIKDCLQLNIIQYKGDKISIEVSEETAKLLKSSHDQIYEIRIGNLSKEGSKAAEILSLFDLSLDENILADLIELDKNKTLKIIEELRDNNILHSSMVGTKLQFTSEGLKKHVYASIKDKKGYHLKAGKVLQTKYPDFDKNELAHQFELGEDYNTCYEVLQSEINEAEKISAYSYQKKILQKLLSLPITEEQENEAKILLSEILYKSNEFKNALQIIEELIHKNFSEKISTNLLIMKGRCLIELGEYQEGKDLLNSMIDKIHDNAKRDKLIVELAYANFDLKLHEDSSALAENIINSINSSAEDKGKCYNLLGMIEIYKNDNLNSALQNFKEASIQYGIANIKRLMAAIEVNIGNIYNIKNEYNLAEEHWNNSLKSILSIGNLEQEAKVLLNYGVYYYNNSNFDKAINQYIRAYNIFMSLGDQNDIGFVLINLGEVYLSICEYQNCYNSLNTARTIFKKFNNSDLEGEVLFLLGKFYFFIGYEKMLLLIIEDYKALLKSKNLSGKHHNYLEYLERICSIQNGKTKGEIELLRRIRDNFWEQDDVNHFLRTQLFLIATLISNARYKEAMEELNKTEFINLSKKNLLVEAERIYLLGKISYNTNIIQEESSIIFFEKAFSIIKDEIITELTWKILLELAESYANRGNYTKVKDYINYSRAVINYLADKIEDIELQKIYLNSELRKKTLKRLEYLEQLQTADE